MSAVPVTSGSWKNCTAPISIMCRMTWASLGSFLSPAVVQSIARSGQANGRDKLQVETGLAEMMSQSTVIIAGRLKPDPYRQFHSWRERWPSAENLPACS